MKKIFICSPYRGDVGENIANAIRYCKDVIKQGHLPIAPHLYFPSFLDDDNPDEREQGIRLGLELLKLVDEMWVYGKPSELSEGMKREVVTAFNLMQLYNRPEICFITEGVEEC